MCRCELKLASRKVIAQAELKFPGSDGTRTLKDEAFAPFHSSGIEFNPIWDERCGVFCINLFGCVGSVFTC